MKEDKQAIATGKRIRRLRKAQNLTQIELGKKTGITSNTISLLEKGKQRPSQNSVEMLTKVFGVTSKDIVGY